MSKMRKTCPICRSRLVKVDMCEGTPPVVYCSDPNCDFMPTTDPADLSPEDRKTYLAGKLLGRPV